VGTAPVPEKSPPRIIIVEDLPALAEEASTLVLTTLGEAIAERGTASVILAGGSTPRPVYALLAAGIPTRRRIPVSALSWFFGDERWVPVTDPQSNEGMARESLLGLLHAPESSIHSWNAGAGNPVECARRYGESVAAALHGARPDVVLLGIGPDGHTASLFPGAEVVLGDGRAVPVGPDACAGSVAAAVRGGSLPGWRLTLCPDILGSARHVVFLAAGPDKTDAVRRAANGHPRTPAAWIRGTATTYLVTRDAAGTGDTGLRADIQRA
jgi:6-phosphogluconolactonase